MSMYYLVLFAVCCTATLGVEGRHDNSDARVLQLLDEMNQRIQNLENQISELQTQNKEQVELNTELKNKNDEQRRMQMDLTNNVDRLKHQILAIQKQDNLPDMSGHQNDEANFDDAETGVVAFFTKRAAFTGSDTEPTLIPFDLVEFNIGNAYDPITGTFTPPVDGLYSISFEVMSDACGDGTNICIKLQVNGDVKSESCSEYPTNTGTALTLQLSAGDAVGLYMDSAPSCLSLRPYDVYNKFSGHLIYQII